MYSNSYQNDFKGAPPPLSIGPVAVDHMEYFQNFRNENISRIRVPRYEWGLSKSVYTPSPDVTTYTKSCRYLTPPHPQFSMIDRERHQEVDDFYIACQLHRDQYRENSGSLHPLDYFKTSDYLYQCPPDPTTRYLNYPDYHVKYDQPLTFPLTLERSLRAPSLPDRALTGVFDKSSDCIYKK
ncbi:ciliary microtubule inner protein 2C [Leptinotarsa decemlineata]|uniref:ciliary microtubule inner protein 2C n=1 Tax=Leptinotarsa decemlineata TaxID=7539 RepID=UPI000C252881|nr:uncharacterized protein LOC111513977 [Leptinotarsa decemlineata]